MSLFADNGVLIFRYVGIPRDYRHKIRPLNSERRVIYAVGSAKSVRSDLPLYIPIHPLADLISLVSSSPQRSQVRSSARRRASSMSSLFSPLYCQKDLAGVIPVGGDRHPAAVAAKRHQVRVR